LNIYFKQTFKFMTVFLVVHRKMLKLHNRHLIRFHWWIYINKPPYEALQDLGSGDFART